MLLSIIIISYNTAQLTLDTINSVLESVKKSEKLKNNFEIILVDNNSSDNTLEKIKKLNYNHRGAGPRRGGGNIKIIQNKQNLGFSKANNQGIGQATGKYILLLNSDTLVLNNALEKLVEKLEENKNLGALAAKLLNKNKTIQLQGGNFPSLISIFNQVFFLDDLPFLNKFLPSTQYTGKNTRQIKKYTKNNLIYQNWVGGTAICVPKKVFDKVGLLDEKIFMYGEDIEFCFRVFKNNLQVAILPTAEIIHLGSASSSSTNAILGELKNYLYFFQKYKSKLALYVLKIILFGGVLLRVLIFGTIVKDAKKRKAYNQALGLFF